MNKEVLEELREKFILVDSGTKREAIGRLMEMAYIAESNPTTAFLADCFNDLAKMYDEKPPISDVIASASALKKIERAFYTLTDEYEEEMERLDDEKDEFRYKIKDALWDCEFGYRDMMQGHKEFLKLEKEYREKYGEPSGVQDLPYFTQQNNEEEEDE